MTFLKQIRSYRAFNIVTAVNLMAGFTVDVYSGESFIRSCIVISFRYKDFRDPQGNKTEFYYQLLCIRLVFVILFEVRLRASTFLVRKATTLLHR